MEYGTTDQKQIWFHWPSEWDLTPEYPHYNLVKMKCLLFVCKQNSFDSDSVAYVDSITA